MDPRIGIDIGNVLRPRLAEGQANYLNVQPFDDAFESSRQLRQFFGAEKTFLVSRCSEKNEGISRTWLRQKKFFDFTGVLPDNLHYCRKRSEKRIIAEQLRLTHFVDDRWTVLTHLVDLPCIDRLYLLWPLPNERTLFQSYQGDQVLLADTWPEIINDIKSRI